MQNFFLRNKNLWVEQKRRGDFVINVNSQLRFAKATGVQNLFQKSYKVHSKINKSTVRINNYQIN